MRNRFLIVATMLTFGVWALGCQENKQDDRDGDAKITGKKAVAQVKATTQGTASGTVTFTQMGKKVMIVAHIEGLKPGQKHGFHIHEGMECGPDGKAAAGHYNPEKHNHAGPETPQRHAGDLGNITANDKGVGHLELTVENISIGGDKNDIVGRCVVVHAKADDLKTQPTGDAGDRIGCGKITAK
jgi:Cu-Zn family superoxide dismutase